MSGRLLRSSRSAATGTPAKEPQQLSSPPVTPVPSGRRAAAKNSIPSKPQGKIKKDAPTQAPTPESQRKLNNVAPKVKEDPDELPHNLGKRSQPTLSAQSVKNESPTKKLKKSSQPLKQLDNPENKVIADKLVAQFANAGAAQAEPSLKKNKKGKKDTSYGHTPGATPFPDYARPTPEECQEVTKLLSSVHGNVQAPKIVQQGSMTVAGCGEVPHVLEALIRTRLSANTNGDNSSRAFQGIVKTFGTVTDRAGRTMVDWNAIRLAPQTQLFAAIEKGGLANVKSKDIKRILDMVYEENQQRRSELLSKDDEAPGEKNETEQEKKEEIERADDELLSLDHLHLLSQEEAFNKLISYPGIGAKTASCVLLFCLQRPSFAVDTHVWRLCSWLGWVPKNATRDQTFSHCEVRVPDELKYPLHQLLIKHGKQCPKCQAKMNKGKQNLKLGDNCVIEHLVQRFNHKASGSIRKVRKTPKKGGKGNNDNIEEIGSELSELSDVGSDEDEE
jgi:endonuclease III